MDRVKRLSTAVFLVLISLLTQLVFFDIVYNSFIVPMGANPVNIATIFGAVLVVRYFRGRNGVEAYDVSKGFAGWVEATITSIGFNIAGIVTAIVVSLFV